MDRWRAGRRRCVYEAGGRLGGRVAIERNQRMRYARHMRERCARNFRIFYVGARAVKKPSGT